MFKNTIIRYGGLLLWSITLVGYSLTLNAAESVATTIPTTELTLDSGHHLSWNGGPLVKICAADSSDCTTGKMPKTIDTFYSVSAITNLSGAKASWKVTSRADSFICSLLPLSTKITCAKIPPAPTKLVRSGSTVKVETLDNSKAIAEVRNILEGELAYSSVYMSAASNTTSVCEIPPPPADTDECHYEDFDVNSNQWICTEQTPQDPPEEPDECEIEADEECEEEDPPEEEPEDPPEADLPSYSSPSLPLSAPCSVDTGEISLTFSLTSDLKVFFNSTNSSSGFCSCQYAHSLVANAQPTYTGQCAKYVRKSLMDGNASMQYRPASGSAKDYGPLLLNNGFSVVSSNNYIPSIGDTVVFNTGPNVSVHGHIQGYTVSGWVSDTIQPSFWPSSSYKINNNYTIYRPEPSTCACD